MRKLLAVAVALVLALLGCQSKSSKTDLFVFAAASLKESFGQLSQRFEQLHPTAHVVLNLAGSQQLALQIKDNAPCDVFASADLAQMNVAESSYRINSANVIEFAENHLVILAYYKSKVEKIEDLAKPQTKVVLAANAVPAGEYALKMLAKVSPDFQKQVLKNVASYETDVRSVVTKVELGEADAGVAYATDALIAKHVRDIPIPARAQMGTKYYITALQGENSELAKEFVKFAMSDEGQKILADQGFKVASG